MLVITKNTYPKDGIGKHKVGTKCIWLIKKGHLSLVKCDDNGTPLQPCFEKKNGYSYDENSIFSHGQVYALNGNLLSGKKEPIKIGLVAKFVKNGYYLEVSNCC